MIPYVINAGDPDRARFIGDVDARYFLERWKDSPRPPAFCRVRNVSSTKATFVATAGAERGERVAIGVPEIGVIRGRIVRAIGPLCTVELQMSETQRSGLVQKLAWLERRKAYALRDRRDSQRFTPEDTRSAIAIGDGELIDCEIVDVSRTGALVKGGLPPRVGTNVRLGLLGGTVVRHARNGYAIQFDEKISDPALIQDLISVEAERRESALVFVV